MPFHKAPEAKRKSKLIRFDPTDLVPFMIGQSVQLKSGGPPMTVTQLTPRPDDGRTLPAHADVVCVWFAVDANGKYTGPHTYEFKSLWLTSY